MLLLLLLLKNIENPKIHKRWSAHAQYFTRCPQGFLQGFHQVSYKAFTRLHKAYVRGVYNAAQQASKNLWGYLLMITSPQRRN